MFLGQTQNTEEQGEVVHAGEGVPACKWELVWVEGGVQAVAALSVGEGAGDTRGTDSCLQVQV